MERTISFNIPNISGKELEYIREVVLSRRTSGDGPFTKKCHEFFENKYGFKKVLLTTSCTDALEMASILLDIKPGDEVIIPAYTFVSTANAFALRGAKIVFADSYTDNPNMDPGQIEKLITPNTRAIIPMHYAGVACDMDLIENLAGKRNLFVVEDAAQAIDSFYKGKALGSLGHLAAFSFHETKNIISGEGGMIVINSEMFIERAEIIREKGTNRSRFLRGEIDNYNWVDIGSSFLPSELIAAFLYAQLEYLDAIQSKRKQIWKMYYNGLKDLDISSKLSLPVIPDYATNNASLFYVVCRNAKERNSLILYLSKRGVSAVFHYLSLHKSPFYSDKNTGRALPNADKFSECLVRLPFYFDLSEADILYIIDSIHQFFT